MTRIFSISRDELLPGALLAAHLFLSVTSIVLGKAARDALFLSRFSVQVMTVVDIATMLAAAAVVAVQLRLNAHSSTRRLLLFSPLCFAVGDVALWLGLSKSTSGALLAVAYLWVGIQASFSAPQASVLAGRILTLTQ